MAARDVSDVRPPGLQPGRPVMLLRRLTCQRMLRMRLQAG